MLNVVSHDVFLHYVVFLQPYYTLLIFTLHNDLSVSFISRVNSVFLFPKTLLSIPLFTQIIEPSELMPSWIETLALVSDQEEFAKRIRNFAENHETAYFMII